MGPHGRRVTWLVVSGSMMLSCLTWDRAANASCECDLGVSADEFMVQCYETCSQSDTSSSAEADWKWVSACHARAFRFAIHLHERLQRDPSLAALARRSRLEFGGSYGWSDTLGRGDWSIPAGLEPREVDSLLVVFREMDRGSSATVYSVQLGVFRDRQKAMGVSSHLDDLRPSVYDEGGTEEHDTTLHVDWSHSTCAYTIRPNLFIWASGTETGLWRVYFGLFIDRRDAERTAQRLRLDHRLSAVVRALPMNRELLQAAVRQWRARGMTDTN